MSRAIAKDKTFYYAGDSVTRLKTGKAAGVYTTVVGAKGHPIEVFLGKCTYLSDKGYDVTSGVEVGGKMKIKYKVTTLGLDLKQNIPAYTTTNPNYCIFLDDIQQPVGRTGVGVKGQDLDEWQATCPPDGSGKTHPGWYDWSTAIDIGAPRPVPFKTSVGDKINGVIAIGSLVYRDSDKKVYRCIVAGANGDTQVNFYKKKVIEHGVYVAGNYDISSSVERGKA